MIVTARHIAYKTALALFMALGLFSYAAGARAESFWIDPYTDFCAPDAVGCATYNFEELYAPDPNGIIGIYNPNDGYLMDMAEYQDNTYPATIEEVHGSLPFNGYGYYDSVYCEATDYTAFQNCNDGAIVCRALCDVRSEQTQYWYQEFIPTPTPTEIGAPLDVNDFQNMTATRSAEFVNSISGAVYDHVSIVIPFLVQILILILVITICLAVPILIWRKIKMLK